MEVTIVQDTKLDSLKTQIDAVLASDATAQVVAMTLIGLNYTVIIQSGVIAP